MPDLLRQRPRIAVADPILTHPLTLAILSLSSDTERDDTVRSGLKSTKQDIGLNAGHAPGAAGCAGAARARHDGWSSSRPRLDSKIQDIPACPAMPLSRAK